jgi:hypothetical protein
MRRKEPLLARNLPLICIGAIAANKPDGWRDLRRWNGDCFVHSDVDGLTSLRLVLISQ